MARGHWLDPFARRLLEAAGQRAKKWLRRQWLLQWLLQWE